MERKGSSRSVFVETYGCQMNDLDSELVRSKLVSHGYTVAATAAAADIVLLNTCSVRALAEQKVWSQLGRLGIVKQTENPDLIVGLLGCMAEREGKNVPARAPHVSVICGPSRLDELPEMLARVESGERRQTALEGHTSNRRAAALEAGERIETLDRARAFDPALAKFQAFVRITRGCNKFCSFCVVPYVRGPEVHRRPEAIIEEVQRLTDAGAREVTLIGQTVNHYRYESGGQTTSFADLLWRVHEAVPALPRLRFVTSYPRDFGDDALDVMAAAPRICRYLHLPAQSGSNRLLQLMNRGYTVEEYEALIERARARMPDVRFAGDMIVGFPTESDADHRASVELLERVRYKNAFIFKYSPRDGTVAARRLPDDIPEAVKRERNRELLETQGAISLAANQSRIGESLSVLVESQGKLRGQREGDETGEPAGEGGGHAAPTLERPPGGTVRLIGRTTFDEIVAFDGPPSLIGTIVEVTATGATPLTIFGGLASQSRAED